jgi:hypothetical protein
MAQQANRDKFDCIRHVLKSCETLADFEPMLKRLLNPPKGSQFMILSTVHKAKGLESPIVGILNPPVPSSRAETTEQKVQEANTEFVAHTRTMQDQYFLYLDKE